MKKIYTCLFILVTPFLLLAENVNGLFQGYLSLAQENTVSLNLEEIAAIDFDKETSFLEGIELKIEVPRDLLQYRNSFAVYVYKNISPQPSENDRFYRGSRIFMRMLPVQNDIYIRIPAFRENSIVQSADSILIPGFTPRTEYPLLVTILPIMKGIPESVYSKAFDLTCKPIYSPKGSLSIEINSDLIDGEETFSVTIDGQPVKWPSDNYILDQGLHNIFVLSSSGMEQEASVVINAGEKQNLDLQFTYAEPEIKIEAPEGIVIYLDDELLIRKDPDEPLKLESGDHSVVFEIGGYQFSRDFTVTPGDSLIISLQMDVLIHNN